MESSIFRKILPEHDLKYQGTSCLMQDFTDHKEKKLVIETVRPISPWIFTLEFKRLPQALDFYTISTYLPNLSDLKIKYSDSSAAEYKNRNLGMKFAEAANLS